MSVDVSVIPASLLDISVVPSAVVTVELGQYGLRGAPGVQGVQGVSAVMVEGYFFRGCALCGGNDRAGGKYAGSVLTVERRSVSVPSMLVNVGGVALLAEMGVVLDLDVAGCWDSGGYASAGNRAGRDFFVYACVPVSGSVPDFVVSAQSAVPLAIPSGAVPSVANSRKIGGFHCVCVGVGVIGGHDLSGYLAGDVLPRSVWDLDFRPVCSPGGMVFGRHGQWVDIYLPSVGGGELVSVFGGGFVSGSGGERFHGYKFDQWFGRVGKRPIGSLEFVAASLGSNQGTIISPFALPAGAGGHVDTVGRRMVSGIGCEDMCGVVFQLGREEGASPGSGSYGAAFDGNDSGVMGFHALAPSRPGFGGSIYIAASYCGSRCVSWSFTPLSLSGSCSSRGVSELAPCRF